MVTRPSARTSRRRIAVALLVLLAAAVVATTVYGSAATHQDTAAPAATPTPSPSPAAAASTAPGPTGSGRVADGEVTTVPATTDPQAFARSAAEAVFAWDTTSGLAPGDYIAQLIEVADPTGVETPGLVADLSGYMPSVAAWEHLRQYATRQWLDVSDVAIPERWGEVVAQAPQGSLAPGTTALTVTGVRHRAGLWDSRPIASEHEVAITAFVVCAPTYPECRLLRLSQLDKPLR
ncbi:hypothetical protein [Georgenia yuyongxinii]|uniref:Secreted protein n=1 Tax=Georgenia yuyongxinii TaxID=2589797 RepID=A0A552WX82_9MICO|nr:hypothetical protein [Georgenia yuyongxinii]TRW47422.1 hypothetical protein FJ693_01065 [Georgenia yuyongxinii]